MQDDEGTTMCEAGDPIYCWACERCGNLTHIFRDVCARCHEQRPEQRENGIYVVERVGGESVPWKLER